MRRLLTSVLALILVLGLAVPVSADSSSGWIELLEFSSIQANGENTFIIGSSGKLSIPVHVEKRFRKVDILLSNPSGQRFSSATCTVNGKTNNLEVLAIGGNLTRIVGYIPDAYYDVISIDLKKETSTQQTYEVLSWKVTPVGDQEFVCDARVLIDGGYYGINELIDLTAVTPNDHAATMTQVRIEVRDWAKYDNLSIWGSSDGLSIDSIRASLNTSGLPMQVNLFQYNDAGSWTEFVFDIDPYTGEIDGGAAMSTPFYGKYLYCVTVDLAGVDRTQVGIVALYLTGHYDTMYGATFNCQFVNGHVNTADTTAVTWWGRFTTFMTNLFSPSDPDAEDFGSTMESQADEIQDAVDELDQVTKPDVEDLDISLDEYLGGDGMAPVNGVFDAIFSNEIVVTMLVIALTCAFASYALFGKR